MFVPSPVHRFGSSFPNKPDLGELIVIKPPSTRTNNRRKVRRARIGDGQGKPWVIFLSFVYFEREYAFGWNWEPFFEKSGALVCFVSDVPQVGDVIKITQVYDNAVIGEVVRK